MEGKAAKTLMRYKHAALTCRPNSMLIPVTQFNITDAGARSFNAVFDIAKSIEDRIIRTPSGGISCATIKQGASSDWRRLSHCIEVTIICSLGMWRFQFRSKTANGKNEKRIAGRTAFGRLRSMLREDGVELEDFAIKNGEEVKKQIQKPLICLVKEEYAAATFQNAHHIDFHSSYPAGLANKHPEFKRTIERVYEKRHGDEINKAILNYSIGFMQSIRLCHARWAHLSRDAIADNNARLRDMARRLAKAGRTPILFNTDGVWYCGEIYHGDGEGDGLGQWRNDHQNCTLRVASPGSYEYIEDGKYYPVVRGVPDKLKKHWRWGAIFTEEARPVKYIFTEEKGIIKITEDACDGGEKAEIDQ